MRFGGPSVVDYGYIFCNANMNKMHYLISVWIFFCELALTLMVGFPKWDVHIPVPGGASKTFTASKIFIC